MNYLGQELELVLDLDRGSIWKIDEITALANEAVSVTASWQRGRHEPHKKTITREVREDFSLEELKESFEKL